MSDKEGVMAAIMAVIDQVIEEEALAVMPTMPRAYQGFSPWKSWGLGEMMRMRILCQLRK